MEKQSPIGRRYMQIGWRRLMHHCDCLDNVVDASLPLNGHVVVAPPYLLLTLIVACVGSIRCLAQIPISDSDDNDTS